MKYFWSLASYLIFLWSKRSHPEGTEHFSVEAADLAGAVVQSQDLGVTVAVTIIGNLQKAEL